MTVSTMPVSSAMLVSGEPNAFPRQQAGTTSSVRLRKRRDDLAAPGRRKERHSGDFSYTARLRPELASEPSDSEGDWNYITFPQGEATVQEVRVTTPLSRGGDVPQTSRGGGDPNPVRLRTSLQSSRAVSSSAVNLQQEPPGRNPRYSEVPHMRAQDRSHLRKAQEEPRMRANPRREDVKLHVRTRQQQQQDELKPPHGQEGVKLRVKQDPGSSNCPHRRQSHLADLSPVPREEKKGNSKRCSGEFEFRKGGRMGPEWSHVSQIVSEDLVGKAEEQSFTHEMVMRELSGACDTGSEGSEESGVFSTGSSQESPSKPRPGLGRRAVTQVDIKERKNSYNSALARSQENLVTVSSFLPQDSLDSIFEQTFTGDTRKFLLRKGNSHFGSSNFL